MTADWLCAGGGNRLLPARCCRSDHHAFDGISGFKLLPLGCAQPKDSSPQPPSALTLCLATRLALAVSQFFGQFDTASILCTRLWEVCVYYSGYSCTLSLSLSLSNSHTVGILPTQSQSHGGVLVYPSRGGRLAAAMWRHYSLARSV